MVIIWLLYGYYMVIIWLLYGYYMVIIWLLYGYYMVIIWLVMVNNNIWLAWCNHHLEKWWSSPMGRMTSHIWWKIKKCLKPPTAAFLPWNWLLNERIVISFFIVNLRPMRKQLHYNYLLLASGCQRGSLKINWFIIQSLLTEATLEYNLV